MFSEKGRLVKLRRSFSVGFFEYFGKVAWGEAGFVCDLGNVKLPLFKQLHGLLQSYRLYVMRHRHINKGVHLAVELYPAHGKMLADDRYVESGFADVFKDVVFKFADKPVFFF